LELPPGWTQQRLRQFVGSIQIEGAVRAEYADYCDEDFLRFVQTWNLVRELSGRALELGSAPYFTTMLVRTFSALDLTSANFFRDDVPARGAHEITWLPPGAREPEHATIAYDHFNVEHERFPYADTTFDAVLFCEIIEHLLRDPLAALREMHRVLKPDGVLVVTTPNVARLENVARLIAGANIYDPYSAYGPYGRHNREYTLEELSRLLTHAGFAIDTAFTADVHDNGAYRYAEPESLLPALAGRFGHLGQYLFVRARRIGTFDARKPAWLYRSYAAGELST
jgi:SAM-dependent methyltransferase